MPRVRPLDAGPDDAAVDNLWRRAQAARRQALGLPAATYAGRLLGRADAFGVGVEVDGVLRACALAAPSREDDGYSRRLVPGLVHVYGIATDPDAWNCGYATRALRALLSQVDRRGYARAQLWTYDTNAAGAHVYSAAGFTRTGRQKVDEHGEPESHWLCHVQHPTVSRPAARLLCLDSSGRVLLQRYRDPVDGFELWEPPGGGIEPGERPVDTALREWAEETRLPAPEIVAGPVDVGRDMLWKGRRGLLSEQFFLARIALDAPAPRIEDGADLDADVYLGHTWVAPGRLVTGSFAGAYVDPDVPVVLARLR